MSKVTPLISAVLERDLKQAKALLAAGESPDQKWGTISLLSHAALSHNLALFELLLEYGAAIPKDILSEIISWELSDYIITSDAEEDEFVGILERLRSTPAWLSFEYRSELVAKLGGDLSRIAETLLKDCTKL